MSSVQLFYHEASYKETMENRNVKFFTVFPKVINIQEKKKRKKETVSILVVFNGAV